MYARLADPVVDIEFGTALQISLDHYYDLLKEQVGGLKSEEYLQLKLVADTVDVSEKAFAEGGYPWWSYFNLLNRSDRAIEPTGVTGEVETSLVELAAVYGRFLRQLRSFVVIKNLSPADQLALQALDMRTDTLKSEANQLFVLDRANWKAHAEAMGYDAGDRNAYVQWSNAFGHLRDIERKLGEIKVKETEKRIILDRKFPDPTDREIVDAEFDFDSPGMRLRYPIHPDMLYSEGDRFSVGYLAMLPLGSTALFDDRRALTWDKSLKTIKTGGAGSFSATLDKSAEASTSISSDWSGGGSARYGFLKVKGKASSSTKIQEDFRRGTKITLEAQSAQRINIGFPSWFKPALFKHKHVLANPHAFLEFFGENGVLLYHPTALIFVRGFSIAFESSQKWTYDYQRSFSASGGGGFRAFGVNFGGSGSYNQNVKEHRVTQSDTKLAIADDPQTLRFVGYAVKKNDMLRGAIDSAIKSGGMPRDAAASDAES